MSTSEAPIEDYDVLIVGGGPAGLSLAAQLGPGIRALLVHQDREIGRPVRTSGGCWLSDVRALDIPERLYNKVATAQIFSDSRDLTLDLSSNPTVILDVTGLYKWLAEKVTCEIRLATKFITTRLENGHYISTLRGDASATIRSRYIIDASGWHSAVLDALELSEKPTRRGVGIEYEFPLGDHPKDRAVLFFGSAIPTGYGWGFPTADGQLRLGVGLIQPVSDASPKDLMAQLIASGMLARMGLPEPKDYHVNSGILPSVAYDPRLLFGHVLRVGDSANMATPVLGEGIRIAIEQGRAAGEALKKAVETGQDAPLKAWERAARRKLSLQYRLGFAMNQVAAGYGPEDWDKSVDRMSNLPPKELIDFFRNDFSLPVIAKRGLRVLKGRIRRKLGV